MVVVKVILFVSVEDKKYLNLWQSDLDQFGKKKDGVQCSCDLVV